MAAKMKYVECKFCQAHLDSGEECNCQKGPAPIDFDPLLEEVDRGPSQYELYLRSKAMENERGKIKVEKMGHIKDDIVKKYYSHIN